MKSSLYQPDGTVLQLIKTYFNDPDRQLYIEPGTVLLRQNEFNDRLYLVLEGMLEGTIITGQGHELLLFTAGQHMFVGVYSFFSKIYSSSATVIAREPTHLAYIDLQTVIDMGVEGCISDQFMPVVVSELVQRGMRLQELSLEKEQALKKILQVEKLASLGQMAAGISHELNNVIAVIQRNATWLCDHLQSLIDNEKGIEKEFFLMGKQKGHQWSSKETRTRIREIQKRFDIDYNEAEPIARSPLTLEQVREEHIEKATESGYYFSIGAACHDVKLAAEQAAHVVKSVRTLATQHVEEHFLDVNEAISEAITLSKGLSGGHLVEKDFGSVPRVRANKGQLIQIFTNLLKNAYESLNTSNASNGCIHVQTRQFDSNVRIRLIDNGPGIPTEILPTIFQPNVTTKVDGLSFGLGLGLTIVEQIIVKLGGSIDVKSKPGKTVFQICLPGEE
jgi:signal transduction histidine kinase